VTGGLRSRADGRRDSAAATAPGVATPEHPLVDLQRASGNAAVSRLVAGLGAGPAPVRRLARYEGGEHAMFGGTAGDFKIAGVSGITEGDLIALGDLYETPEELNKADKAELRALIDLIHRDRKAYETGDATKRVSHEEWEAATKGRAKKGKKTYLELAADNESHFAPPKAGATAAGRDHKSEWQKHHRAALDQAHAAASGDKKVPKEALVTNAFAAHFLTDAFSAGHLVAKADLMADAQTAFSKLATTGWVFRENQFTRDVGSKVLADPGAKKKLDNYLLDFPTRDPEPITPTSFSELLWQMSSRQPDRFFGIFAKIVHDQLNEHIDKLGGIEVDNEAGDPPWRLPGDATLASSSTTQEIGKKAVAAGVKNLETAATTTGALKYDDLFKSVWKFTPRPTKDGQKEIAKAMATFGDAAKPEAVAEFVELTIAQLDLAIAELKAAGHLIDKPKPKAAPGGGSKTPAKAGDRERS
jgi:hypothetical protein